MGLLLSYLAVSWLLLYAATSYVVAKRHLQDTRLSASGICPYKHCSSVDPRFSDAAIDIHSSGSTDPKLVAAAAAGLGPRNSLGGVSAAGSTRIPASYPGTGGMRLQENFSQSSDVELFTPHSRTQLFGLGRPGSSSAASSSNAARSDADTSVDIAQYYRAGACRQNCTAALDRGSLGFQQSYAWRLSSIGVCQLVYIFRTQSKAHSSIQLPGGCCCCWQHQMAHLTDGRWCYDLVRVTDQPNACGLHNILDQQSCL